MQRQCQEESAKIAEKSGNGFANSAFSVVIILVTFNKETIVPQLRDYIVTILIRKVLIVNSASGTAVAKSERLHNCSHRIANPPAPLCGFVYREIVD